MNSSNMISRPNRDDIEFDAGIAARARIGFVLLAMEQTMEHEIFRLTPPGVGVYFQRAPMANVVNVDTLTEMAPHIGDAAAMILPDIDLDVICYGCTSGSVVIGEDRVFDVEVHQTPPPPHLFQRL